MRNAEQRNLELCKHPGKTRIEIVLNECVCDHDIAHIQLRMDRPGNTRENDRIDGEAFDQCCGSDRCCHLTPARESKHGIDTRERADMILTTADVFGMRLDKVLPDLLDLLRHGAD